MFSFLGRFASSVVASAILILLSLLLVYTLKSRPNPRSARPSPPNAHNEPTRVAIVLGSGGHTAEMFTILEKTPLLFKSSVYRLYIVSSGDGFSAAHAKEFESKRRDSGGYGVVVVRRARRVHQSLFSTPFSALQCIWDCLFVLRGSQGPDQSPSQVNLIITNGPGTGVCVVLATLVLRFLDQAAHLLHLSHSLPEQCRSHRLIFIESWARVKTLSLSGRLLLPLVDRFLVQWPSLQGRGRGKAEYVGALVF